MIEVLKQALEALETPSPMGQYKAITAIKEALAQTQEPVVWYRDEGGIRIYYETKAWDDCIALYTTPPQRTWVGLTTDEIAVLHANYPNPQGFALALQAKLKEKNNG